MKVFKITLDALGATGNIIRSEKLSMDNIEDDSDERAFYNERLMITMGDYAYFINKEGKILEETTPFPNVKNE